MLGGNEMTISGLNESQRTAAKVAGFTCLFIMATAVFAHYGISAHLIVAGDAAATARNIMAHERLFRITIACYLIYGAGDVVWGRTAANRRSDSVSPVVHFDFEPTNDEIRRTPSVLITNRFVVRSK
jgi:hypothetical protein